MNLTFSGEVWHWRGPAPFFFVTVSEPEAAQLQEMSAMVTYGWGMIPAVLTIGDTTWETALWPKDGGYVVPLKAAVRKAEGIEEADTVTINLTLKGLT